MCTHAVDSRGPWFGNDDDVDVNDDCDHDTEYDGDDVDDAYNTRYTITCKELY